MSATRDEHNFKVPAKYDCWTFEDFQEFLAAANYENPLELQQLQAYFTAKTYYLLEEMSERNEEQ